MSVKRSPPALLYGVLLLIALLLGSQLTGQRRPAKHPDFSEGYRAYKQQEWEKVADRMLMALSFWEEDGEPTRVYGRWSELYLPRYYLGVALYELHCYEAALSQLDKSVLNNQQVPGANKEQRNLISLQPKCERLVRQDEGEGRSCASWTTKIEQLEKESSDV